MIKHLLSIALLLCAFSATVEAQYDLTLNIQNLSSDEGTLQIAVYAPTDKFLDDGSCTICKSIKLEKNVSNYIIEDVPAGEYAIAILHDTNNNKEMDFNFIGIPKEGYGFSNNPKARMRQPTFEESRFTMSADQSLMIKMTNW